MSSWPLLLPTFALLPFFSFFPLRLLLLTHFRESPVCENLFPPIFWHSQKIYAKKIYFLQVNFIFLRKKADFLAFFLLFTASVRSRPPEPPAVPGVLVQRLYQGTGQWPAQFFQHPARKCALNSANQDFFSSIILTPHKNFAPKQFVPKKNGSKKLHPKFFAGQGKKKIDCNLVVQIHYPWGRAVQCHYKQNQELELFKTNIL